MSKIPFVLKPKKEPVKEVVGNEETGAVEVLRRGFLTVGEKSLVQGANVQSGAFRELQALAARIAEKNDLTVADVMAAMGNGTILDVAGAEMADELGEVLESMQTAQYRRQVVCALAILMYRVDADISMDDVMDLHPDLIAALAAFYEEEEARTWEGYSQPTEETQEGEEGGKQEASN